MSFLVNYLLILLFLPNQSINGFDKYSLNVPNSKETIQFVPVKGAEFQMGSNNNTDEKPIHTAKVSDFWMSTHEITWQQYDLFVRREKENEQLTSKENLIALGIDGITSATQPYTDMSFGMGRDNYPAVNVTHYAAISYCKWLSALTGEFYRLPTEREWEFAAKGGQHSDSETLLSNLGEYAWHKGNSSSQYHQVGKKKPNTLGLFDILGNVAEWTMDGYAPYETTARDDFWQIPRSLYPRVARGGSWMDEPSKVTPTIRIQSKPQWKIRDPQLPKSRWWHTNAPFIGFRIVRPRNQPSPEEAKKYWIKIFEDYN